MREQNGGKALSSAETRGLFKVEPTSGVMCPFDFAPALTSAEERGQGAQDELLGEKRGCLNSCPQGSLPLLAGRCRHVKKLWRPTIRLARFFD